MLVNRVVFVIFVNVKFLFVLRVLIILLFNKLIICVFVCCGEFVSFKLFFNFDSSFFVLVLIFIFWLLFNVFRDGVFMVLVENVEFDFDNDELLVLKVDVNNCIFSIGLNLLLGLNLVIFL